MEIKEFKQVERSIIEIRGHRVITDADVAVLYGVETKRINEAVRNNREKFPAGYVFELTNKEVIDLRSNFSTANISTKSRVLPKVFTEKGLYMLATILKSPVATQATLAIIETFAKVRELNKAMTEIIDNPDKASKKSLMKRSSELISELINDGMKTSDTETTIELNFAVLKLKHTVKRKSQSKD